MTTFEKLGAVRQAASEKLLQIIMEAHEAGSSPYRDPAFAESLAIVQGVEIAAKVAHKFEGGSSGETDSEANDEHLDGKSFQVNENTLKEGDKIGEEG